MLKVNQLSGFGITGTREPLYLPVFTTNLNTNAGPVSSTETVVQKYAAAVITQIGSSIKLVVQGASSGTATLSACYIGRSATSGKAWDFAATPTQITWNNGQTSLTLSPNQIVTSDAIAFEVVGGQALSIAFNRASNGIYRVTTSAGSNYIRYRKGSVSEANLTSKGSSYSATSGRVDSVIQLLVA